MPKIEYRGELLPRYALDLPKKLTSVAKCYALFSSEVGGKESKNILEKGLTFWNSYNIINLWNTEREVKKCHHEQEDQK